MSKTCLDVTLEDVGKTFAKHGYVKKTNHKPMQYNAGINSFLDVSEEDMMDIFKNVYPNFERRKLSLDLLDDFLPSISSGEVQTYERCKLLKTKGKENILKESNSQINNMFQKNKQRKKDVGSFTYLEYDKMIQHLINNDIFTDGRFLYTFANDNFRNICKDDEVKTVSSILNKHHNKIKDNEIVYGTVIEQAKKHLTNIQSIKNDIARKYEIEDISKTQWETYNRINTIIASYGDDTNGI